MASTCFGHLHVHLQEFLYIGCFIYEKKIIVKLFASIWYIFLT